MCDTQKIWDALSKEEGFDDGSQSEKSLATLRAELIDKTPEILAGCLDQPVTLASLAVARSAVAAHCLSVDLLGKMMRTLTEEQLPAAQRDEAIAEAAAVMQEYADLSARAAQQAVGLPDGAMTEDLMYAHNHLVEAQLSGFRLGKATIRDLVETYPSAIFAVH